MNSEDDTLAGGLPHSEIPGSPSARISPGLFAACHVLHRLSVPRHPPDALASRLIIASPSPAMPHHRRAQGQTPCLPPQQRRAAVSMKTLLSDSPRPSSACTRPVRLGHITTLSSPFNQPCRGRPRRCRSIFSERRARAGAANRQHLSVQLGCTCRQQKLKLWQNSALPVVEVNGFEPMTSCLQSRR